MADVNFAMIRAMASPILQASKAPREPPARSILHRLMQNAPKAPAGPRGMNRMIQWRGFQ